jgi:hypothetical protein
MKVVPQVGDRLPDPSSRAIHAFADKYLPGAPFAIEYVADIPLTAAGKRKVVVVERPPAAKSTPTPTVAAEPSRRDHS